MRKEILTSVCALSLLFGASSAFAGAYGEPVEPEEAPAAPPAPPAVIEEEEPDYARVGPYLGIGGVYAVEFFNENNAEHAVGSVLESDSVEADIDNSSGFHVLAGYRVHPNIAVEARYEHLFQFNVDGVDNYDWDHQAHGRVSAWNATANVKAFFLTGRWQPYAVLGLGYLEGDGFVRDKPHPEYHGSQTDGDFMMRFGLGMDACITEHIAIGPEIAYVLPFGDVEDFDFMTISAGLRYKF